MNEVTILKIVALVLITLLVGYAWGYYKGWKDSNND